MQEQKYIRKSFILRQETKGFQQGGQVLAGVLTASGQTASISVSGAVPKDAHIFLAKAQEGGTGFVDLGVPGTLFSRADVGQTGYSLEAFDLVLCGNLEADGTFGWQVSVGYLARQRAWRGRVFPLKTGQEKESLTQIPKGNEPQKAPLMDQTDHGAISAKEMAKEMAKDETPKKATPKEAETARFAPNQMDNKKEEPKNTTALFGQAQKPTLEEVGNTFRQLLERFGKEEGESFGAVHWKDLLGTKPMKAASREETEPLSPLPNPAKGFASVTWPRQKASALPLGTEEKREKTEKIIHMTKAPQTPVPQERTGPSSISPWQVLFARQSQREDCRSAAEEGCWPDETKAKEEQSSNQPQTKNVGQKNVGPMLTPAAKTMEKTDVDNKELTQEAVAAERTIQEPKMATKAEPLQPTAQTAPRETTQIQPTQQQQEQAEPIWEAIWKKLLATHPAMVPFARTDAQWLRICREELWLLPKQIHPFTSSSVVALGDKKYRHLLLGKDNDGRFFLAVPGQYGATRRKTAQKEGFFDFWSKQEEEAKEGSYGYWMGRLQ